MLRELGALAKVEIGRTAATAIAANRHIQLGEFDFHGIRRRIVSS